MPTNLVFLAVCPPFFFIGKSLVGFILTTSDRNLLSLFFSSAPEPQYTCQWSSRGQLTNDTLVLKRGFDLKVTKGLPQCDRTEELIITS